MTVNESRSKLFSAWNNHNTKTSEFHASIDAFERSVLEELARRFDEMASNTASPAKVYVWQAAASMARGEIK